MHHHIFALFLQTVYANEKLLAGFKCETQNWYESVFNLTALSRNLADDVTAMKQKIVSPNLKVMWS